MRGGGEAELPFPVGANRPLQTMPIASPSVKAIVARAYAIRCSTPAPAIPASALLRRMVPLLNAKDERALVNVEEVVRFYPCRHRVWLLTPLTTRFCDLAAGCERRGETIPRPVRLAVAQHRMGGPSARGPMGRPTQQEVAIGPRAIDGMLRERSYRFLRRAQPASARAHIAASTALLGSGTLVNRCNASPLPSMHGSL